MKKRTKVLIVIFSSTMPLFFLVSNVSAQTLQKLTPVNDSVYYLDLNKTYSNNSENFKNDFKNFLGISIEKFVEQKKLGKSTVEIFNELGVSKQDLIEFRYQKRKEKIQLKMDIGLIKKERGNYLIQSLEKIKNNVLLNIENNN